MSSHNLDCLHSQKSPFRTGIRSGLVFLLRFLSGSAPSSDLQSKALHSLVLSPFLTPAPPRPPLSASPPSLASSGPLRCQAQGHITASVLIPSAGNVLLPQVTMPHVLKAPTSLFNQHLTIHALLPPLSHPSWWTPLLVFIPLSNTGHFRPLSLL